MSSYHLLPNLFSLTRPSQQSVKPRANFNRKLLEMNRLPVPVHMYVSHKLAKTLGHEISLQLAYIVKLLLILLTIPENTRTYHNAPCLSPQNFA